MTRDMILDKEYRATGQWELGEKLTGNLEIVKDCCWYLWDCDVELTVSNVRTQTAVEHNFRISEQEIHQHLQELCRLDILID